MRKNSKTILLNSAIAFSLACNIQNVSASASDIENEPVAQLQQQDEIIQNYLKVKFENKILFHKQVNSGTIVQVFDTDNNLIESEVLESEKELELNDPKIPKGKMLSYWSFKNEGNKLLIKPILIDSKSLNVIFYSSKGGELIQNNGQTNEISMSVDRGTTLKDILPKTKTIAHFKFKGWFNNGEKVADLEDARILSDNAKYYAKFYQDFNNNSIDDLTEKITVKFVTNSKAKIKSIETNVGDTITLPKLTKNSYVFMGWYTDKNLKNAFKNSNLTKSYTLYAKWEKVKDVIKKSETEPIKSENISDQLEQILNQHSSDKSSSNNSEEQSRNGGTSTTFGATQAGSVAPSTAFGATQKRSNTASTTTPSTTSTTSDTDTTNIFTEKKYVFNNKNLGHRYMIKFFDENETFLFSLILPYGKTLKTYDENNQLREEYSVRQDTTITLNTNDYINYGSTLLEYRTREVKFNSAQITEIYPLLQKNNFGNYKKSTVKEHSKSKVIAIALVTGTIIIIISTIIYLFIKRKKKMQKDESI